MKKILLSLIFNLLFYSSNASHIMGGEITWECLGPSAGSNAGKYIFTVRFYRDCTGITPVNSPILTNVPGVPTIAISAVSGSPFDLSPPNCFDGSGNLLNCNNAPNGALGLIHEYVWKSAPVTLTGVPPAIGWAFTWSDCCRNTVANLNGGSDMLLRARMFPYNGRNAAPCFDNSPCFAEKPSSYICTGYQFTYNYTAFDRDLDSLSYSWANPLDGSSWPGNAVPFSVPYSINNQLPGAPVLDQQSGEVTYTPAAVQGNFATCVRVDAFKCGQKVAEIYREVQVSLSSGCAPVWGGGINTPPAFRDPSTNLTYFSVTDSVYAGDSVSFSIKVQDLDFFNSVPPILQSVTIHALGAALDSVYFASPSTGCNRPPCATLTSPNPFTFQGASVINLNWKTSCNHLPTGDSCVQSNAFYQFLIRAVDNYCPAPGRNNILVNVVVLGPSVYMSNDTLFCNFPATAFQWFLNDTLIPGATANYFIPVDEGVYSVVVTSIDSCNLTSPSYPFLITSVEQNNLTSHDLEVMPNPSDGKFSLRISGMSECNISVYDLTGRSIYNTYHQFSATVEDVMINLSSAEKGIYILKVNSLGAMVQRRIVIH